MFVIKRALKLNNKEATLMAKHAGFRRVVYNMALSLRQQLYGVVKTSDSKAIGEIKKILTNHIKKRPENAWMNELSSRVYQNALRDLNDAFSRFRKGLTKHPVFASRKDGQSFTVDNGNGKSVLDVGGKIKIPTLGIFRLHEPLDECIAKTFKLIKIEDLNVSGMLANHKLAGAIADLGFYEFRRQLEYKALMYGSKVETVSQWFPSSKTCSNCGHKQDMPLSIRTYDCPVCGMSKDRDLNAAINILNYQPSA